MDIVIERRSDLTLEVARKVAFDGARIRLGETALQQIARARTAFERLIEEPGIVIYGVTSGYGQHAYQRFTPTERRAHARRPPIAAQAHWGEPFPERAVRLMVLARLANFIEGHSAVTPELAQKVAAMLDGPPPMVPLDGAVCAGEILPLSWLFGDLAQTVELKEKESLSLINGAPMAAALVTDGTLIGERRRAIAEDILALAAEAYKVPVAHFSVRTAELQGDPFEIAAAKRLSSLIEGGTGDRRPYQAPVTFRILPKMLGRLRRDLARAEDAARISLPQVSDNPTFFPPEDDRSNGEIHSTGGYHNAAAWPALNALAMAYADLTTICDRIIARMLDGNTSGLPPQLMPSQADDESGLYLGTLGFGVVGYGEAARRAAQAVFLPGSESGGFVQNDVAVPTALAWKGQEDAGRMLDLCLGAVAVTAVRAFAVTNRRAPPALAGTLAWIEGRMQMADTARAGPGKIAGQVSQSITERIYGPD
jgi:histidine ammonia-lyase